MEAFVSRDDLGIRVTHAATGELLRELNLNPDRDYQPLHNRKPPNPNVRGFSMS